MPFTYSAAQPKNPLITPINLTQINKNPLPKRDIPIDFTGAQVESIEALPRPQSGEQVYIATVQKADGKICHVKTTVPVLSAGTSVEHAISTDGGKHYESFNRYIANGWNSIKDKLIDRAKCYDCRGLNPADFCIPIRKIAPPTDHSQSPQT